jgi:hypothetical protein
MRRSNRHVSPLTAASPLVIAASAPPVVGAPTLIVTPTAAAAAAAATGETQLDAYIRQQSHASSPALHASIPRRASGMLVPSMAAVSSLPLSAAAAAVGVAVPVERRFSVGSSNGPTTPGSSHRRGTPGRATSSSSAALVTATSAYLHVHGMQHRSKSPVGRGPRVEGRAVLEEKPAVLPFLLTGDTASKPSPRYKGTTTACAGRLEGSLCISKAAASHQAARPVAQCSARFVTRSHITGVFFCFETQTCSCQRLSDCTPIERLVPRPGSHPSE